jgi:uncharacterized surface protein with fasciclin (FAS1) repeats
MRKTICQFIFAAVILCTVSSCEKKNPEVPSKPAVSIANKIANGPGFTFLNAALQRAGYTTLLDTSKALTVFAPTDDAFKASGFATIAAIQAADTAVLRAILRYHVIASRVAELQVPAGPNASVNTLGGAVFATRDSRGVFINGNLVQQTDIAASNGFIHVLGRVLVPAPGNLLVTAQARPDFSYLVAAIVRANTSAGPDLLNLLGGSTPLTVYAPADSAFRNAGFASIAAVQAADSALLRNIISLHIVPRRIFSNDIASGATDATYLGGLNILTYRISSGITQVRGRGNAVNTFGDVRAANIVAGNGVLHGISRVLLP